MESLRALISKWRATGVTLLPPEPPVRVEATFRQVGVHPTPQVLEMYSLLGGMAEMDSHCWKLWSLADVVSENEDVSKNGVLFSDYLINSWCFRLRAAPEGEMGVYIDGFNGEPPKLVAGSLAQFFDAYIKNPDAVLSA